MEKDAGAGNRIRVISEHPRRASYSSGVGFGFPADPRNAEPPLSPPPPLVCWTHVEWAQRFPWLIQGTTGRSPGEGEGDFRIFDEEGLPRGNPNWLELARGFGFDGVTHTRQVHGKRILLHREAEAGLSLGPDADGHISAAPGSFMGVTVADCVPVFLLNPSRRAVALLHAGWRGTASGILEEGISRLREEFSVPEEDVLLHLGPAICGVCYEVGPEVHAGLGLRVPDGPAPVDLRGVLAERAVVAGLQPSNITRSSFCTRCSSTPFFSHRAGESKRQAGFLGIRPS